MNKQSLQYKFDVFNIVILFFLYFGSICFTSVIEHVLLYFLPVTLVLRKILFGASFLQEILWRRFPGLAFIAFGLFVIPVIMGFFHQDFNQVVHLQWINQHNSWLIFYAYLGSSYFLYLNDKLKGNQGLDLSFYALLSFLFAFVIDFFYSVLKWFLAGFEFTRWQGSSGNPQLWAVQASLMLILWFLIHKKINQSFGSKIPAYAILCLIILAIVLTESISNFVGLVFASLAYLLPSGIAALVITLVYVLAANILIWNFLINYQGDVENFKNIFHGFSNKFLPRMRLWLDLLKESPSLQIDYVLGLGLNNYNEFLARATNFKHQNAHSLYFHNFLINGIAGIYLTFIFLIKSSQKILSNKYYLAICLYALSSSVFDCALSFLEVEIVFWLALPLIISHIDSRVNPQQI